MRAAGKKVVLVTRDKDLSQLVRPGDEYWDYIATSASPTTTSRSASACMPERMACFLALIGDAVDNIPGVPGVGRKTAVACCSRTSNRWCTCTTTSIGCSS